MFKDIGRFVGRYMQVLAFLSIAGMIVDVVLHDSLHLDCTVLFMLWAAHYLIRHHPTARKWTIAFCGICVGGAIAAFLYSLVAGTEGMTVRLGTEIRNPSLWHVAAVAAALAAIAGLPLALLLTSQAKREFSKMPDERQAPPVENA